MSLIDVPVRQLLDAFSAPTAAPGGGAAAALAGALGASLVLMVASLPKTKTGAAGEREALDEAARQVRPIRERLMALVDEDTAAYNSVVAAYRLPKGSEEESARRTEAIQAGLRRSTEVPLEVMRLCEAAGRHAIVVARKGNPVASSDLAVGLELLHAAATGAALNVKANLGQIRDGDFAARAASEMRRLDGEVDRALGRAREALG
ncbi:MAG TPA: cyclodeaminase/cyclohydrolase family protein [Vicinamibacterales bacterium]|nr:cyclodeaminase/cyclohydrolase family protein [Vicinamibacterales bacterium]